MQTVEPNFDELMKKKPDLDEIQRMVNRGRELRALHFAAWGRNLAQNWASVFRGPGRKVSRVGHQKGAVSA